jgi:hypothetical protein
MRRILVGVAMFLVIAGLTAGNQLGEPQDTQDKPKAKTLPPDEERRLAANELEALRQQHDALLQDLRRARERQATLKAHRETSIAEFNVKLAMLEAEHKLALAKLDKEILDAGQATAPILSQIADAEQATIRLTEALQMQGGLGGTQQGGLGGGKGKGPGRGGRGGGPDSGFIDGLMKSFPKSGTSPSSDAKLDEILQRLERLETRLRQVENRLGASK